MSISLNCVKNRLVHELHGAQFWATVLAGCTLQLQHHDGVRGRGHQDVLRHEQGHLGAPHWPVAAEVKAVDPHLTLEREKTISRVCWPCWGAWEPWCRGGGVGGRQCPQEDAQVGEGLGGRSHSSQYLPCFRTRHVWSLLWLQCRAGRRWMTLRHIHQVSEFCPGSGATWGWGACLHTPASARGKQEPSSPDTRTL